MRVKLLVSASNYPPLPNLPSHPGEEELLRQHARCTISAWPQPALDYFYQSQGSTPLVVAPLFTVTTMGVWSLQSTLMPHVTNFE